MISNKKLKLSKLMRTLSLACIVVGASAGYGTTGHYGNQYGHGGHDDHSMADHYYGYDQVESRKDLESGAGLTRNTDILTALTT